MRYFIYIVLYSAFIFISSTKAFALPESQVLKTYVPLIDNITRDRNCYAPRRPLKDLDYRLCHFETNVGVRGGRLKVYFTKYYNPSNNTKGSKGSLVIAPGRTESSFKYIEVAHDFIKRGYNPVYVIDHRSQGFSGHTVPDTHKVHVSDFDHYVNDFTNFINLIVLEDPTINTQNMFLISNSMGGAITALYLEREESHPFKASAMFGAMHKIVYPRPFNETLAGLSSSFLCAFQNIEILGLSCKGYAPGRGERFDPENRIFETNPLTHSKSRYVMRNLLWNRHPSLQTGGITVQWAGESAWSNKSLRRMAENIDIPLFVYTASEDTIVDPKGHSIVCSRAPYCKRYVIRGARHEILMESDRYRNPAMKLMWQDFESLNF